MSYSCLCCRLKIRWKNDAPKQLLWVPASRPTLIVRHFLLQVSLWPPGETVTHKGEGGREGGREIQTNRQRQRQTQAEREIDKKIYTRNDTIMKMCIQMFSVFPIPSSFSPLTHPISFFFFWLSKEQYIQILQLRWKHTDIQDIYHIFVYQLQCTCSVKCIWTGLVWPT